MGNMFKWITGFYELKYFFNERIENEDGEEISTRKIKNRIKEIIEEENHKKPLSDDKISELLKNEGFPIARRTVAKYREQLQIPVARLRRGI
jgi:RNA polymerase sigma-54 factor